MNGRAKAAWKASWKEYSALLQIYQFLLDSSSGNDVIKRSNVPYIPMGSWKGSYQFKDQARVWKLFSSGSYKWCLRLQWWEEFPCSWQQLHCGSQKSSFFLYIALQLPYLGLNRLFSSFHFYFFQKFFSEMDNQYKTVAARDYGWIGELILINFEFLK